MTLHRLEIIFETGVGLETGQGSDPECMVQISANGGRTFGVQMTGKLGQSGDDRTRVEFQDSLGQYVEFMVRISVSDPVQVAIISCNATITFDDIE